MSSPAKQPKPASRTSKKNRKNSEQKKRTPKTTAAAKNSAAQKPRGLDEKDRILIAAVLGLIFGEFFWNSMAATLLAGALSAALVWGVQLIVKRILANQEAAAKTADDSAAASDAQASTDSNAADTPEAPAHPDTKTAPKP